MNIIAINASPRKNWNTARWYVPQQTVPLSRVLKLRSSTCIRWRDTQAVSPVLGARQKNTRANVSAMMHSNLC